jgi:hypothetical protein
MKLHRVLIAGCVSAALTMTAAAERTPAGWQPEAGDVIQFKVLRKGEPFGTHAVRFEESADGSLVARTTVSLKAGLGPVTLYRYQLDATEKWIDGELVELKGAVNDDGKKRSVSAKRVGNAIEVKGSDYTGKAPESILPASHWNYVQTATQQLLSTEDGEILDVKVTKTGRERIKAGGKTIEANRYRLDSALDVDLWYDDQGRWVKLAFEARGQEIEYVLDRLY